MSKVMTDSSHYSDIADAIRDKLDVETLYKPSEMAAAIESIETGTVPTGTVNITQNGTVDVTQYASAAVAVPNTYGAGDEGKVVSNGALVSQGSQTIDQNGTYDTTLISEAVVNVSGGLIVSSRYSGLSYGYIASQNGGFYTYDSKTSKLDLFEVQANHRYVLYVPSSNERNRGRISFFSRKTYSDFEQYIENPYPQQLIYNGNSISDENTAPIVIDYKPNADGVIIMMTNASGYTNTFAYCLDLYNLPYSN